MTHTTLNQGLPPKGDLNLCPAILNYLKNQSPSLCNRLQVELLIFNDIATS
jgi:hypothetical protein